VRDVAIVSFAQTVEARSDLDEVEMLAPTIGRALATAKITKKDVDVTVSASCDYLGGRPFSFVTALDAVGAWPPIRESHVEMDGAWAVYEAWVALQHGDIDVAMVYAFGRSTQGRLHDVLSAQLDPYLVAPLGVDAIGLAALQARAMIDAGVCSERDMASVVSKATGRNVDELLGAPYVASPLRAHDCGVPCDAAAVVVLAAGDRAKTLCSNPAWIRGIDHRIEPPALGSRDLTRARSIELAAAKAGVASKRVDVAQIEAPYSHQALLVAKALGLDASVSINPSGGSIVKWPFVVSGLLRMGEAAQQVIDGKARRAVAHATSGACLQQNLVCVFEGAS
jgi:acetyl-CoA acetyltransferase